MIISDLETALAAALEPLKISNGVAHVEVLGAVPADAEQWLAALGRRAPFIVAVYSGAGAMTAINAEAGVYRYPPEYTLLIGVSKLRANADARDDLHSILAAIILALSGRQFGLDILPCALGRVDMISWTGPLMVFGVTLTTEFAWIASEEAG